jgi:hypothetical protein
MKRPQFMKNQDFRKYKSAVRRGERMARKKKIRNLRYFKFIRKNILDYLDPGCPEELLLTWS